MYRAVVLTTLVLLLLAVAGVSVAQESRIFAGEPNSDGPPESTTPERTSFDATGSEVTTNPLPGASSETEDRQNIPEPTVGQTEKPTAAPAHKEIPTPGPNDVGNTGDSGRVIGKPEHASIAPDVGNPRDAIGHYGTGKPEKSAKEEPGRVVGRQKVVLCHKGNKTLTVGAPAQAAHLRHGDSLGTCP